MPCRVWDQHPADYWSQPPYHTGAVSRLVWWRAVCQSHPCITLELVQDCQQQRPGSYHRFSDRSDTVSWALPSIFPSSAASSRDSALPCVPGAGTPGLGSAGHAAGRAWVLGMVVSWADTQGVTLSARVHVKGRDGGQEAWGCSASSSPVQSGLRS